MPAHGELSLNGPALRYRVAMAEAVYRREGDVFHPLEWAGSPWSRKSQHGGPVNGLVASAIETASEEAGLQPARIAIDLLGPVPMQPLRLAWEIPWRRRRLAQVEVRLFDDGRPVAQGHALLLAPGGPERPGTWPPVTHDRPGPAQLEGGPMIPETLRRTTRPGFHHSLEVRRVPEQPCAWLTTPLNLIEGRATSALVRCAALADLTGGIHYHLRPPEPSRRGSFINTDTLLHLERMPVGRWLGLESLQISDHEGIGLAAVRLLDERGPFGISQQSLLEQR